MRIVALGSCARIHATCWKLMQDSEIHQITCIPGNSAIGKIVYAREPMQKNLFELVKSLRGRFDLAVIGPEQLLADGLADRLHEAGIPTFGPSAIASRIESSKFFAKGFMDRHQIPTACWKVASHIDMARNAIRQLGGPPIVLKADGLAAGKGVIVADTADEAEAGLRALFVDRIFGDASQLVVVEEKLIGIEVSAIGPTDGCHFSSMESVMDYKQALSGDKGKNTGGMGAHSPSFALSEEQANWVTANIMQKAVDGLRVEGREFRGALYAGLMVEPSGSIKVLEFNGRPGDPEWQALMMRLRGDLAPVLYRAATGVSSRVPLSFTDDVVLNTVLASRPYPDKPVVGEVIEGLDAAEKIPGVQIFHAGTALQGCGKYITTGGRVLSVCGRGKTLEEARAVSLKAADLISWKNKTLRRDIGWRVLKTPLK